MKKIYYILFLLFLFSCKNNDKIARKSLEEFASMHNIPGWAFVSWENGKIKQYYFDGYTLLIDSTEINEDTYFEAASLSKTIFAALVVDYFELNSISIDSMLQIKGYREKSQTEYDGRIKPPVAYSALNSSDITARKILTHTAGLGDWILSEIKTSKNGYYYSGEGFLYLQRWIEERENKQLDSVEGFQLMNSLTIDFTLSTDQKNTVWGHDNNLKAVRPIWYSEYPYVHGTLCCRAESFAEWWLDYLKDADSSLLNSSYIIDSNNFRTAGLGLLQSESHQLLWQHGNDSYFQNLFVHDLVSNSGFVVFTNSQNGFAFINEILGEIYNDNYIAVNINGLYLLKN